MASMSPRQKALKSSIALANYKASPVTLPRIDLSGLDRIAKLLDKRLSLRGEKKR